MLSSLLAFLVLSPASASLEPAKKFCEQVPAYVKRPYSTRQYCFSDYVVEYDMSVSIPVQTSYQLNPGVKHDRYPFNNVGKVTLADFDREAAAHKAGFDFAPLANNTLTNIHENERNHEVNRLPMYKELHRDGGMWQWLNEYEASMPIQVGRLYSVSGAIAHENDYKPKGFYKILFQPDINMAIAFLVPHKKTIVTDTNKFITTIGCIEDVIGHQLLTSSTLIPESLRWSVALSAEVWADGSNESKECIGLR